MTDTIAAYPDIKTCKWPSGSEVDPIYKDAWVYTSD